MIITEERRQQLIADFKEEMRILEEYRSAWVPRDKMIHSAMGFALAALEANPVYQFVDNKPADDGYAQWADCNPDFYKTVLPDERRALYDAPPVPVMKLIEIHPAVREYLEAGIVECQKLSYGITGKEMAECMAKLLQPVYMAQAVPVGDHG